MKEVKLDVLGRVHIPKKIRDELKLEPDSHVYIEKVADKVVITKRLSERLCPVCNIVFTDEFSFCPYCGEVLTERKEN